MLKINDFTEEYLNFLYKEYCLEDDEKLTSKAQELKYKLLYIINELLLHEALLKVEEE